MFSITDFAKENLINGFQNSSFTLEQVNIMCVNYSLKGMFGESDILEVTNAINPQEQPIEG